MLASQPPERPVRLGLVGVGRWGTRLCSALGRVPGAELSVAFDVDHSRLTLLPAARRARSLDELLRWPALDAVIVATPPASHAAITLLALDAGLHAFVEKPLTLDLAEAKRIEQRARSLNRRVMVGHVLLYHPAVRGLRQSWRRGEFGELVGALSQRIGSSDTRDVGAWWSLCPHDLSVVRFVTGQSPVRVELSARADAASVTACVWMPDGTAFGLRASSDSSERQRRIVLVGTEQLACFDELEPGPGLRVSPRTRGDGLDALFAELSAGGARAVARCERGVQPVLERATAAASPRVAPDALWFELSALCEAIRNGAPTASEASDGVEVVRVLSAGAASTLRGRPSRIEGSAADRIHAVPHRRAPSQSSALEHEHET